MKMFRHYLLLLSLMILGVSQNSFGQCTAYTTGTNNGLTFSSLPGCGSNSGNVTAPSTGYAILSNLETGGVYTLTRTGGSSDNYYTVRSAPTSGTVFGYGYTPLTFQLSSGTTADVVVTYNGCGTTWGAGIGSPPSGGSAVLQYTRVSPSTASTPSVSSSCTTTTLSSSASAVNGFTPAYQWQGSNDNTTWANISGATTTSYAFTSATSPQYLYYRMRTGFGTCYNYSGSTQVIPRGNYTGNATVSSSTTMAGTYTINGDFVVNSGVTITIATGCELTVNATNITMNGTIDGNAKGANAGGGGGGGGGGNGPGAGSQSGGGGRGSAGGGSGGGGIGNNGNNGGNISIDCGFACVGGRDAASSGGSGGSGGGGGGYGGSGGGGGYSASGVGGGDYPAPGSWVSGGASGGTYGNGTDASAVTSGSGGGGAGGGGGGWQSGTSGSAGGRGGSAVSLIASGSLTVGGSISVNGGAGGNGGNGGGLIDGSYNCTCINSGFIWLGASGCRDNSLCGVCTYYTYPQTGGAGGGGGGGSGGGILLEGFGPVTVIGSLTANGGAGGSAVTPGPSQGACVDYAEGGGGGGGGRIKIIRNPCESNNISPSTISVSGGSGGGASNGNQTGVGGSSGSTATSIDHPSYSALTAGSIGGAQTICTGGAPSTLTNGGTATGGVNTYTYTWYSCAGGGCTVPSANTSPGVGWTNRGGGAGATTFSEGALTQTTSYIRQVTSGGCTAYAGAVTVTVVADPVAQTINPSPASGSTVCTGAGVSATFSGGSGGTGTITDTYEYSTNSGGSWSTYVPGTTTITASTPGTNILQIRTRRSATGTDCNTSGYNTVMWSVAADPVAQTISPTPANGTTVCSGATVSATFSGGSGGSGTITDVYEYSTNSGGSWSTYVPGTTVITASGTGTGILQIRTHRTATGSNCDASSYNTVSWSVAADPVSQTINPTPASGSVICAGATVSATFSGGSGGTGTISDNYEYSTNSGGSWSTYVPGTTVVTASSAGSNILQIRTHRTATGNDCNAGSYNTATWTVVNDPAVSIDQTSQTICYSSGMTLTATTSGGTGTCSYQWQQRNPSGSGTWTNVGTNSNSLVVSSLTSATDYRVTRSCTGSGCDNSTSSPITLSITTTNTWTGAAGSGGVGYWDVPGNWSCGIVPTVDHNVIIPSTSVAPNQPYIRAQGTYGIAVCKSININSGANLTTQANGLLKINQ